MCLCRKRRTCINTVKVSEETLPGGHWWWITLAYILLATPAKANLGWPSDWVNSRPVNLFSTKSFGSKGLPCIPTGSVHFAFTLTSIKVLPFGSLPPRDLYSCISASLCGIRFTVVAYGKWIPFCARIAWSSSICLLNSLAITSKGFTKECFKKSNFWYSSSNNEHTNVHLKQ